MGYPTPFHAIHRRLNPTTVIASVPFSRGDKFEFGNRMAVINIPQTKKLIVWGSLPLGSEFQKAIDNATNDESSNYEIAYGIVPDREHTLAAIDLKKQFPNVFLIGPDGIAGKPDLKLDYTFKDDEANKIVKGESISESLKGFEFLYFNNHTNGEVVMLDKSTKTLFEADLLFNIPYDGVNHDQYPHYNQNRGVFGYLTCFLNGYNTFGRIIHRRLLKDTPGTRAGVAALLSWDFDSIVMSHGKCCEEGGKELIKKVFDPYV